MIQHTVTVAGHPRLSTYAAALRKADLLTAAVVKDITSWAAQRNQAAHGQFDDLSRERAQIMTDGINLFLRQRVRVTTS